MNLGQPFESEVPIDVTFQRHGTMYVIPACVQQCTSDLGGLNVSTVSYGFLNIITNTATVLGIRVEQTSPYRCQNVPLLND